MVRRLFPATITVGGTATVTVLLDGDAVAVDAVNAIGVSVPAGARVLVDFVGDAGVFVTGKLSIDPNIDWTAWVPTVTGWVAGDGVFGSLVRDSMSVCDVTFKFTAGTATTFGAALGVDLPVAPIETDLFMGVVGVAVDVSGAQYAPLVGRILAGQMMLYPMASATQITIGGLTATVPFTWAVSDRVEFVASYRTTYT